MRDAPPEAPRDAVLLVGLKVADIAGRSGFVLVATYALPIAQAGQFGLIVTLTTLFAFVSGFERHLDIQRRVAGEDRRMVERAVSRAIRFFAFNWLATLPIYLVIVVLWSGAGWALAAPMLIVVIGEHLSTQAYHLSVMSRRYFLLIALVAVKNATLFGVVAYRALFTPQGLDLGFALNAWAFASALGVAGAAIVWVRLRQPDPQQPRFDFRSDLFSQHRASLTHFVIGVVAVLMLQYDRLAVTALLGLEGGGRYFRHALLASLAYQAFNVACFTRISPVIFVAARHQPVREVQLRLMREYRWVLAATAALLVLAWSADAMTGGVYSGQFQVSLGIMSLMLVGFVLRAAADFQGLILNAKHLEGQLLRQQGTAFAVGAFAVVLLTWRFGLVGAVAANVLGSAVYLFLNHRAVRTLE